MSDTPEAIISRFNKHKAVRDRYLVPRGTILDSGEKLIELRKSDRTYTVITTQAIQGVWLGKENEEYHSTGRLTYEFIDKNQKIIGDKGDLDRAEGVLINNKSAFWLPKDAILPFGNLLNFLV